MSQRKLAIGALVLVFAAALLSYFTKFSPDLTPTIDPAYEMSSPELQMTPDPQFARKLLASNIAMVLTYSDFSDKNAVALDALRTWAKERFSEDEEYLHPVSVRAVEHNNNIFSAFITNLWAPARTFLDQGIKEFLRWRIDEFHNTDAYQSLRLDYYGLFGVDPEAATLLARYQEERAKLASNVIVGCLFVVLAAISCAAYYLFSKQWMSKGRLALSYAWLSTSLFYLACSCSANEASMLVSAVVALAVGLYLRFPLFASFDEAGYLEFRQTELNTRTIAAFAWISVSLLGIQILTWVKSGSLIEPDPATLLISSISGNFFHDPSSIKRALTHIVAVAWTLSSLAILWYVKRGAETTPELRAQLERLDHPQRI